MKVLLIDANPEVSSALSRRLHARGIESESSDGGAAYAVVVLDLDLADVASALIRRMRDLPREQRPIVIGTTARRFHPETDTEAVQIIVRKPLPMSDLAEMIAGCLTGLKSQAPVTAYPAAESASTAEPIVRPRTST